MNTYWSMLQVKYQQLSDRVNSSVVRERVLLLIMLVTIIYVFWSGIFISPQHKKLYQAKTTEAVLVEQIKQLENAVQEPVAETTPQNIVMSESTVVSMFKSLLTKHRGVVLKNLSTSAALDEQGITLVFASGYSDCYEYLRSLEHLKMMIFWDELQYKVTEYPNAEIKLTVYTVSPSKNSWYN